MGVIEKKRGVETGGTESCESVQGEGQDEGQETTTKTPLLSKQMTLPEHLNPHPKFPVSSFTSSWLPDDRRAVTYMLHPSVGEHRLLDTLSRRKATTVTIKKAVRDLRNMKGIVDAEKSEVCRQAACRDEHLFVIQGDGSVAGEIDLPTSFVFHPLHRSQASTSVCVEKGEVLGGDPGEEGARGDAVAKPENERLSPVSSSDDSSVDSYDPWTSNSSINSTGTVLERPPGQILPRRGSSIRQIFSRLRHLVHRRSEIH